MKSPRIGFVGLGRMGANMARRLNELGYQIPAVFDANTENAAKLAQELGSKAVDKVSDVSRLSDVIFTVVTDDAAMRKIYFGPENLFANAPESSLSIAQPSARKFTLRSRIAAPS